MKLRGLLAAVAAILVVAAFAFSQQPPEATNFCRLAATIPSGEPAEIKGRTFWIDGGLPPHDEGCGPEYMSQDLDRDDGVIYSNCRILWTSGGATDAAAESIPCTAS